MKMEQLTEEEETPITLYNLFDMTFLKLRRWIDDNAFPIVGQDKATFISNAMNRPTQLALIVMSDKLSRRRPDEHDYEEVEKRRRAIETRDHAYAQEIARDLLQIPDLTMHPLIIEKGYDFAGVFLSLVDQINSDQ